MRGLKNFLALGRRCALAFLTIVTLAIAMAGGAPAEARPIRQPASPFVQSALPLTDALERFGRAFAFDVIFPESLVRNKRAAPVTPTRDALEALRQILAGSGLAARFVRPDAIVLEPIRAPSVADLSLDPIEIVSAPPGIHRSEYEWYGEKLLQLCLVTLRNSSALGERSYDLTVYLWIAEDGTVSDLKATSPEGATEILGIARILLKGLSVGSLPPQDMPQPVGLRIAAQ